MKNRLILLATILVSLTSCKKDVECECTTVFYDTNGYYLSTQENEYKVTNAADCASYNSSTSTEATNCQLDND